MIQRRMLSVGLFVAMLVTFSMGVLAESTSSGSDFKHATTGFILSGGHALAACETCHVGGVFKGTPRNCEGCHALGKRILATPKSNTHIVTDAACESCHFNTSTWLGARYNHGTAVPGQCTTCHNGRIAASKHASHVPTTIANDRCDMCHRTSTWKPASWNHTDTLSDCSSCHKNGGPGRNLSGGHLPMSMSTVSFVGNCKACHTSYTSFYRAYYNHVGASASCEVCHGTYNSPAYSNVKHPVAAIHGVLPSLPLATTCQSCHRSFGSFAAARFDHVGATQCSQCHSGAYAGVRGKSGGHVKYQPATTECSVCHSTASWRSTLRGTALHSYLTTPAAPHTPTCRSCHSGRAHDGKDGANAAQDCSTGGCHAPAGGQGRAYTEWD